MPSLPGPHAIHDAFEQFGAFNQDAIDNKALLAKGGKLTMPAHDSGASTAVVAALRTLRKLRRMACSFTSPETVRPTRSTSRRAMSQGRSENVEIAAAVS